MEAGGFKSLREFGLVGWLLKDFGWVLLLPFVAWPAGGLAVAVEFGILFIEGADIPPGVLVHNIAEHCWLVGNFIWMTSELLYDQKKLSIFPWYAGPIATDDKQAYTKFSNLALIILICGFLLLLGFYTMRTWQYLRGRRDPEREGILESMRTAPSHGANSNTNNSDANDPTSSVGAPEKQDELVFGVISQEIYTRMFLFPWIAKDICWNLEWKICVLVTGGLVVVIAADYVRRYGGLTFWAELCWICGNAVWAWSELFEGGPCTKIRIGAAALLLIGMLCVFGSSRGYVLASKGEAWRFFQQTEREPLLSPAATAAAPAPTEKQSGRAA